MRRWMAVWVVAGGLLLTVGTAMADSTNHKDTLFEDQLAIYEPKYLIFDGNGDIKFFLSSHLRLLRFSQYSTYAPDVGFLMNIKAFWAFSTEDSQPFEEINWNPEVLVRWKVPTDKPWLPHRLALARAHESDGAASDSSRGWDRWKVYSAWWLPFGDESYLEIEGSAWLVAAMEHHWAPDMPTYLGFMNWLVTVRTKSLFGKVEFRVTDNQRAIAYDAVQNADGHLPHPRAHPDQTRWYVHVPIIPSVRVGAGVKLPWDWEDFYIYAEYFSGYGEELYAFNQKTSTLRAGIAIVRDL